MSRLLAEALLILGAYGIGAVFLAARLLWGA